MLFKTTTSALRKFVLVQVQLEQQEQHVRFVVVGRQPVTDSEALHWTSVENADELLKKAGKNLPYIIHFTGFGVLARIAENVPNYKESLLVTGSEEDFYFSCYELKSTVGVSFIRRSLVDGFLEQLTAQKAFVWGVHTGPVTLIGLIAGNAIPLGPPSKRERAPVKEAIPLGPPSKGEIKICFDYEIAVVGGDVKQLERNTGEQKRFATDGGFLDADAAYAEALRRLTLEPTEHYHQGLDDTTVQATKANYKEYVRFVKLGIGILAFFLVALVGNYFYVNYLNSQAAQLESDISGFGDNLSLIARLEQEKERKLLLIENSGVQASKYVSYYLDDLAGSVPAAIQLTALETFPLLEPLKPKRKVELNTHHITITGWSGSSKVLDDWMETLERKPWIEGVELINYVRINDQKATFNLLVKINE